MLNQQKLNLNLNNFLYKLSKIINILPRITISILTLVYLILIPVKGLDKNNRLDTADLGVLTILLLLNSPILDKLQKFQFGSNGVELDLVNSKVQANSEVNKKESKALALLGLFIEDINNQKEFFNCLLEDGEQETLVKLFKAENNLGQFPYIKQDDFIQQLRHLQVLGFIEPSISYQIDELPEQGNLNEYFKLTDTGKICLALGSSEINPQDILNSCKANDHCHISLSRIIEKQVQKAEGTHA